MATMSRVFEVEPATRTDYAPMMGKRYALCVDKIFMLIKNN